MATTPGASAESSGRKRKAEGELQADEHTTRHRRFLSQRLEGMFNVKEMSDITFLVGGEEVYASRLVLTAANDYFKAMLTGSAFKEVSGTSPIEIHGVEKPIFMLCLQYLYSGTAEITRENVVATLRAADMFNIDQLCAACGEAMVRLLDAANCLQFLAVADSLPSAAGDVRAACMDLVEESLGEVFPTGTRSAEVGHNLESLSFKTMHDVCTKIGQGLSKYEDPWLAAACLGVVMNAVLVWGSVMFGEDGSTAGGLYRCMEQKDYLKSDTKKDLSRKKSRMFKECDSFAWQCPLTQSQLSNPKHFRSSEFVVDGCGYRVNVLTRLTEEAGASAVGCRLKLLRREGYHYSWPFRLWWKTACQTPPAQVKCRVDFDKVGERSYSEKLFASADIPELPLEVGALAEDDVRTTLHLRAKIQHRSVGSLCVAYAFFNPEIWHTLRAVDLTFILQSDKLPLSCEDEVLSAILTGDWSPKALERLLPHVRWQFLTPKVLLDCCRQHNASKFRECRATKAALSWLLAQGSKPQDICERRRDMYDAAVQDNRPMKLEVLVTWLLDNPVGPTTEELESASVMEEKLRVMEERARAAEEKLQALKMPIFPGGGM